MNIIISYRELSDIANTYLDETNPEDHLDISVSPVIDGLLVTIRNIKVSFIRLKQKVKIQILGYKNDQLILRLKLSSFLLDLVKKILFKFFFQIVRKTSGEKDAGKLHDYMKFSGSKIYLEINPFLQEADIPVKVLYVTSYPLNVEAVLKILSKDEHS